MDDLRIVNDTLLWLSLVLAVAAIVVVLAEHRRNGAPARWWLLASLVAFAVSSVPIVEFGFDVEASDNAYPWRIVPLCVLAIPGLLARVVRELCEAPATPLHRLTDGITLGLITTVLVAPRFPGGRADDLPSWYGSMIAAFLVQVVLSTFACWQSIRTAVVDQPAPTRLRGAALLGALVAFTCSYAAWVISPSEWMSVGTSALQLFSGVLLVIALIAPRPLLHALTGMSRGEDDDVLEAIVESSDVRADLPTLLARAAEAEGLLGIAAFNREGELLEMVGGSGLEGGSVHASRELRIDARAGGGWLLVWSSPLTPPLRSADRARLGLFVTLVQVAIERDAVADTERAVAERLQAANDRLSEANDLKDRFVALVSHELRTPLTSIIGLARTSYERWSELDPEQVRAFQHMIAQQGERLAQIVEHLLLVSAIEAGAVRTAIEPIDLRHVIETAAQDAGVYSAARIHVPVELVSVAADERLVREILVNFLSNADKYAAPPFDVDVRAIGPELELVVRDHGSGVSRDLRGRLFDRFTRDPDNVVPGTGLGLAIASDLASAMAGSVGHRDAPDGGSEFWLRIPLMHTSSRADTNLTAPSA